MARIVIKDIVSLEPGKGKPQVRLSRTRNGDPPDVTLINLNLMLINNAGRFDQQNYIPLGLLYIAACLEREGCNVEFIDYQLFSHSRNFDADLFVKKIISPAKIIGLSCMSNLLPFTILCAEKLKKHHPECKVILGGVGPSPVAKEIIKAFPFIDSVVEGEGELAMLDFVRGHIAPLPPRRVIKDLDTLPLPSYSLLDFDFYDAAPSIISSRGCPYRCTFCTEPHNFSGAVRYRSVDSVIEELELVHSLSGCELFLFQDDILPLDRARFKKLFKGFGKLSFPIEWKCFSRVDLMDEDLMREMTDNGCVQIRYGIESGSNNTLKRIKKGFKIEKAYEIAKKSIKHFPSVHASFIWGYPFESMDEFETTLDWVSRFEDAGITVLLFEYSPLPGSQIYREYKGELNFSKETYSFFIVTGHEVVSTDGFNTKPKTSPIYKMIMKYPQIFSGFYKYENTTSYWKNERLEQYRLTGRTSARNEYDL
ncbi:MAG: radical SAM protein [Deltaproteobacteria bacterium]|nr:radical SAM protein [Deltaproteobacteria bacterium]MBW2051120.1 radical SAM protein [Deltaproteobacteria bacterium]MBW2141402.1 radical SAM protein [Deltaproteobacteria bacterium]MBW2322866.1 radical SAM protein [Deltaproteobacteria bacterium]